MAETQYQEWIGREEVGYDVVQGATTRRLAALLDQPSPLWAEGMLPPLGHWLFNLPDAAQSQLGEDGHPRRGGFLPPIDLPRRMWAGSRLTFKAPIELGAPIERRSTIVSITPKEGASGRLVFVILKHEVMAHGRPAVLEEQDIVYRGAAPPSVRQAPAPARPGPPAADEVRIIHPDPALLFRFSALTFNAHRIHYDRDYARNVEGYPGLVVQGPLIATLLMDHFLRLTAGARVTSFQFQALRPLFDLGSFRLCLKRREGGAMLWAESDAGELAMNAEVEADI